MGSRNASIREEDEDWAGDWAAEAGPKLADGDVAEALDGGDSLAAARGDGRVTCDAEAVYLMGAKAARHRDKPKRPLARLGWAVRQRCRRLCRTHRFRNLQVRWALPALPFAGQVGRTRTRRRGVWPISTSQAPPRGGRAVRRSGFHGRES